ncbi:MAG: M56 family metallopeptidase, partial [Gammaproteobacteria bacterium]|nr:M56 family metallopeptidase [Gammaproteobacteria bacterium]
MLEPVKSVLLLTLLTGLVCLLVPVLRKRMAATDLLQLLRQLLLLMAVSPILAFGLPELLPSEAANQLPRLIAPALKPLSLDWMLVASSGSPAGLQASQLPGLLLAVWVLVAAVLVFRLLRAVRVYQRIAMQAERLAPEALPVDLPAHVSVAVADDAPNAFAIGRRRPLIVIPARCIADRDDTILDAELAALLLHEAAHVQHGDTLWLPLCRLALCLWWPVIPMWFLYRELTL